MDWTKLFMTQWPGTPGFNPNASLPGAAAGAAGGINPMLLMQLLPGLLGQKQRAPSLQAPMMPLPQPRPTRSFTSIWGM